MSMTEIDIDLDDILPGGSLPDSGAEDVAGGEKPTKDREADARADTDGEGDDRERTGAERKALNRLKRTNSRLSRDVDMLREELAETRELVQSIARLEGQRASGSVAAAVEAAELKLQQAIDDGDSKAVVKAMDERDQAKERLRRFTQNQDADPSPRPQQRQGDVRDNPVVADWLDRNSWFDWNQGDEDSKTAAAISTALTAKGIALTDPRHLAEVERRMRAVKPELFDDDGDAGEPDVPRTAGSSRTVTSGMPGSKRLPPPTAAELRVAEMGGLDLSDPATLKRWNANRAERLTKSGRL